MEFRIMAAQPPTQTPGPQNPGKYPVQVGAKYQYYGEQPGYIYDPYHDTYQPDPAVAKPYYEETGLIEKEKGPPGLGEQLLPVAATAGSIALAQQGAQAFFAEGAPTVAQNLPGMMGGSGAGAGGAGAAGASSGASAGAAGASSGAASATAPVASTTLADGTAGVVFADGSVAPASSLGGSGSMIAAALPWVGVAGMAYAGWKNFEADGGKEALKGKGDSQQNVDALLNSNYFSGWVNPTLKFLGLGTVGNMLGGGRSTKDYQKERRAALQETAPNFAKVYQDIEAQQKENPDPQAGTWTEANDPTGKYVGKKWSWESEKDIRRTTGDYLHATNWLGNAETFGDQWLQDPIELREAVTEELEKKDFYHSNKGDILIADDKQEEARKIYEEYKIKWADPEFQKTLSATQTAPTPLAPAAPGMMGGSTQATPMPHTREAVPGSAAAPGMMGGYATGGGVGGPGYDPDPNRPGHFIKRR